MPQTLSQKHARTIVKVEKEMGAFMARAVKNELLVQMEKKMAPWNYDMFAKALDRHIRKLKVKKIDRRRKKYRRKRKEVK